MRALLLALTPTALVYADSIIPFSYAKSAGGGLAGLGGGCFPGSERYASTKQPSLSAGDTAYVCININGVVTSMYNLVVDQYTAISVTGCAFSERSLPQKEKNARAHFFGFSHTPAGPQQTTPPQTTRAT